jgi:hypothetical protein
MSNSRIVAACVAALAMLLSRTLAADAAPLDQINLRPNEDRWVALNADHEQIVWQQEVASGRAGVLAGVDLYPWFVGKGFTFFVNRGAGWQTDAHDFEAVVIPDVENRLPVVQPETRNPLHIDVSSAGIRVGAGEIFIIGFRGTNAGQQIHATVLSAAPGPLDPAEPGYYAPGRLFGDDAADVHPPNPWAGYDLAFRTHVLPVAEPASVVLNAMAAACRGWLARRRQPKSCRARAAPRRFA